MKRGEKEMLTPSQFPKKLLKLCFQNSPRQEDKKISTKLEVLLYKTAIKTTQMYGNQIWPLIERQKDKISAIEMRMCRHIYNIGWENHVTK